MLKFALLLFCLSFAARAGCDPDSPDAGKLGKKLGELSARSRAECLECGKRAAEVDALARTGLAAGGESIEKKDVALKVARKLKEFRAFSRSSRQGLALALSGQGPVGDLGGLRECDGSMQLDTTWKRVLAGAPKLKLSGGEKREIRSSLVTFLRRRLDGPVTFPELMRCLDLSRAAADCGILDWGDKLAAFSARGRAVQDEIEKAAAAGPQMSSASVSPIPDSERCTIGNSGNADLTALKKSEPLRKDLLAWLNTVK